jgi:hypothetical protein
MKTEQNQRNSVEMADCGTFPDASWLLDGHPAIKIEIPWIFQTLLHPVTFHRQKLCHPLPPPKKQSSRLNCYKDHGKSLRTSNTDIIYEDDCRLVLNLYSLIQWTLPWVYMIYEGNTLAYITTYFIQVEIFLCFMSRRVSLWPSIHQVSVRGSWRRCVQSGNIGLNEAFGELILTLLYYTLLTENTSKSTLWNYLSWMNELCWCARRSVPRVLSNKWILLITIMWGI